MKKESSPYMSCYSSCVAYILNQSGIKIQESDILKNPYLLMIDCMENSFGGIYSKFDLVVNEFLRMNNIILNTITISSKDELRKMLSFNGPLIMQLDCTELTYTSLFSNVKTNYRQHYVVIESVDNDQIYITDLFVPENQVCMYQGWITFDFTKLQNCCFKSLNLDNMHIPLSDDNITICDMISKYSSSISSGTFYIFRNNVYMASSLDDSDVRKGQFFYEMATALATSGTLSSRIFFRNWVKSKGILNIYEEKKLDSIYSYYLNLRILMLKEYLKPNVENITNIYNLIDSIENTEKSIYELIRMYLLDSH